MKINVEVDCTPAEARQFFGLPNVEPMQDAVMEELQKRMLAEIERFSPETLMKSWFSLMPQGSELMQDIMRKAFMGAGKPGQSEG